MGSRRLASRVWLRVILRQLEKFRRMRCFDADREAAFQRFHANAMYGRARYGIAVGLLVWVAFTPWDVSEFPSIYGQLGIIRLLLVAPVLAWLWWHLAMRPEQCRQHLQRDLIVGAATASAGLVLMMWSAYAVDRARAFQLFWPAFSGLFFFLYAFLGLQFRPAALVGCGTFCAVLLLGLNSGVESQVLGSALCQLGLLNITGMIICARSEIQLRAFFRGRQHHFRLLEHARRDRVDAQRARDDAMQERQRAESAMLLVEKERAKLATFGEEKERFFSAAYHDLQQPLSIIGLYSHLAKNKLSGPNASSAVTELGIIERAAYEIGLMFKGVRDIWEIGRVDPVLEPVEVDSILREIAVELRERADEKGVALRLATGKRSPKFCYSDRTLLKRAVSNLASNAVKYTERGEVVVGVVRCGSRVRIDVRDTGVGIAPELRERVFEPYFQVGNPGRNRKLGLGLGLSIVRQIERTLPGHRLMWCSRPGKGSRFSLTAPVATGGSIGTPSAPERPAVAPQAAALRGQYILIVEDDAAILQGLLGAMKAAGCMAEGAESLAEAEAIIAKRDRCPDLLITDFRLQSGATGFDVVAALHKRFEWAAANPVLFVTGDLTPAATLAHFRGPHDIYPKPIAHAELLVRASRLLAARTEKIAAGSTPSRKSQIEHAALGYRLEAEVLAVPGGLTVAAPVANITASIAPDSG